jgi:hypothetical protein
LLLKINDDEKEIYLLQVIFKGDVMDVRNSWDLKYLRSIDFGEDENNEFA